MFRRREPSSSSSENGEEEKLETHPAENMCPARVGTYSRREPKQHGTEHGEWVCWAEIWLVKIVKV